jgi:hypothetical protein
LIVKAWLVKKSSASDVNPSSIRHGKASDAIEQHSLPCPGGTKKNGNSRRNGERHAKFEAGEALANRNRQTNCHDRWDRRPDAVFMK